MDASREPRPRALPRRRLDRSRQRGALGWPRRARRGARLILYDSHCHLDFPALDPDRELVLARAAASGVRTVLVPGVEPEQWERAARLATARTGTDCDLPASGEADPFPSDGVALRFAVGLHPQAVDVEGERETARALDALEGWIARLGAVAIGELGWDAKLATASMARQRAAADAQLELARAKRLPVVLHVLGAHGVALDALARFAPFEAGGVVHAYSGAPALVPRYVELGLHLSFGPSVTRARARRPIEAAAVTPIERLLVETDGPDQYPSGSARRRGEPADVARVLDALAKIRGEPAEDLAAATSHNARALFGPRA